MRLIVLFMFTILLASCTTAMDYYQQTAQSWRGGRAQDLITRWGPPDEKIVTSKGNSMYLYQTKSSRSYATPATPVATVVTSKDKPIITTQPNTIWTWSRGVLTLTCLTLFEVNPQGTIVNVQTQGSCMGGLTFADKMANPSHRVVRNLDQ